MAFDQSFDHIDPLACRALWCAVLHEMWALATTRRRFKDREHHVEEARRWFQSEWCARVCELAGFEHDKVLRAFADAIEAGPQASPWQGKEAA